MQRADNGGCCASVIDSVACRRIIVLDEGRIVQWGTHEQLLKVDGKYRSMWVAQIARINQAM